MLRRLFSLGPVLEVLEPDDAGDLRTIKRFPLYQFGHRLLWGVWRRLPRTRRPRLPIVATSWLVDRLISRWISPSDIFYGWTAVCLSSLSEAKLRGAITLVENPTLHTQHWQNAVVAECNHFGVDPRDCGSRLPTTLIRRQQREYQLCDRIIVPSTVARQSFQHFSYANKVEVVLPGVDHTFFTPPHETTRPPVLRVCYVGRVELVKGVGYLLQAGERLGLPQAELLLIGEIRPEMKALLRVHAKPNVKLLGVLSPQEVARHYRESSIFVMPSVNEGLAQVILEAMASGLPVIATEGSGAVDCITEGQEGFIVPDRNVEALAEAILWSYQHQDDLKTMGKAARAKIEKEFTISDYEERHIHLWNSLLAKETQLPRG